MLSRIFILRPRLAAVLNIIITLAGIIGLMNLPVEEYPNIAPPSLFVSASYTGASADVVEQTVGMPIEDEINGIDDLLYFSSTSSNDGSYSCSVTFRTGTDTDIALVNLQNAVKRAEAQLPSEVTRSGIRVEKRGDDNLGMIAFMTDGTKLSQSDLVNYVNDTLKDALARVEGVSSAELMSNRWSAMRIWLDPLRLAGLGLSAEDVRAAVESQNLAGAAGSIGSEGASDWITYKLNVTGRLKTVEEFENVVVRTDPEKGRQVLLKDVARVELGSVSYAGKVMHNGQESVGLGLYRAPDANALSTMNRVKEELERWKPRFPEGVSYVFGYDPTPRRRLLRLRIRSDGIHPGLDGRNGDDARCGACARRRGHLAFLRRLARDPRSRIRHSGVASRRLCGPLSPRVLHQYAHDVRPHSSDRVACRRRHCGGGKHAAPD